MLRDPKQLDAISLEILHNALKSLADESFIALMKSAYSTNIKERHDHTTVLIDARGRMIVQAERSLPGHLGSVFGFMDAIRKRFDLSDIHPGDLFIANDPYNGGATHLPDLNLAMPIFVDGRMIAMISNIAHHADIGGAAAGSMSSDLSNIYQEGVRVPVVKLFRRGELDHDIFDLILLNVRVPRERRGDYNAQIAACKLGERRMQEIAKRYSADVLEAAFDEIVNRTAIWLHKALTRIPDGIYRFEDVMDDDGHGALDIPIKLEIRVQDSRPVFDFRGSSPQVLGNLNCTLNATRAAIGYALKALLDPAIPSNEGVFETFDIVTDPGTIVSARFPAAVANRAQTSQRLADMVFGALAPALPERALGCSHGSTVIAIFSGANPVDEHGYVYFEVVAGGGGARATKDGKSGVQVHITNTSNLPVEAIEMEYPLYVESYGLIEDSGGPGKYCGGQAIRRVVRPLTQPCTFEGNGERFRNSSWGIFGGRPGRPGRFLILDDDGTITRLPNKPAAVNVRLDQRVVIEAPGGGGYGPPERRAPAEVEEDRRNQKYSRWEWAPLEPKLVGSM